MITLKINNNVFFFNKNISILEACRLVGVHLPRFCYHEILSIVGNCRMCLVEIEKSPKPVVSCAMPVSNNLSIITNSPLIKKSRENILELLLLNHPLDCPICDQGGECDLQDQVHVYGLKTSRNLIFKRGVEDKNYGVFIKTIMTRCIHCTRCIRFSDEIAGILGFGTFNRGLLMEIGSYTNSYFNSEISGNVIDLCPVGALTSKPYAFKTRSWELKVEESIDCTDNFGSNILINFKDNNILRIQPKINKNINQTLITDRIRFSYDSLNYNRINQTLKRSNVLKINADIIFFFDNKSNSLLKEFKTYNVNNFNFEMDINLLDLTNLILLNNNSFLKKLLFSHLIKLNLFEDNYINKMEFIYFKQFKINSINFVYNNVSLQELKTYINFKLNEKSNITIIVNDTLDLNLGTELLQLNCLSPNIKICNISSFINKEYNFLSNYFQNNQTSLFLQKNNVKTCFLLSVDLKLESTLLNVKIRNRCQHNNLKIFSFGCKKNSFLNIFYVHLSIKFIFKLIEGKIIHSIFILKNSSPLIIIGDSIKKRFNWKNLQVKFLKYCPSGFFINVGGLSNTIGMEYLNFSFLTKKIRNVTDVFILLNLEDNIYLRSFISELKPTQDFLWFNTHMSLLAKNKALFIGAVPTFLESESFYVNFENIIQKTQNIFKKKQTFNFSDLFLFKNILKISNFNFVVFQKENFFFFYKESLNLYKKKTSLTFNFSVNFMFKNVFSLTSNYPLKSVIEDFFLQNIFTKNSKNLLLRSQEVRNNYVFVNK